MEPLVKTRFPIKPSVKPEQIFEITGKWLVGNRDFVSRFPIEETLDKLVKEADFVLEGAGKSRIQKISLNEGKVECAAFSFTHPGQEQTDFFDTRVTYRKDSEDSQAHLTVSVSYGSASCFSRGMAARKPVLVNMLLEGLPEFSDWGIPINTQPHLLQDGDEIIISDIINNKDSENILPVVYVSLSNSFDKPSINPDILAKKLAGLAHVIVEPSHNFSREVSLRLKSKELACYDGAVRVYWPKVLDPRLNRLWIREVLESANQGSLRGRDFIEDITSYVLSRTRSMEFGDCGYDKIAFLKGLHKIQASLKHFKERRDTEQKSNKELSELYEGIINQHQEENARLQKDKAYLDAQLSKALDENETLKDDLEVAQLNLRGARTSRNDPNTSFSASSDELLLALKSFIERDRSQISPYYSGIIKQFLDSRREQLTSALNVASQALREIDSAFSSYSRLNPHQVKILAKYGFVHVDDGPHYKIMKTGFNPDVFVTLAKTPSDHRTGKNFLKDMTATFFRV